MMNQIKMCLITLFVALLALGCEREDFLPTDSLNFRSELLAKYESAGYSDVAVRSYKKADPASIARMVCVSFEEDTGFLSSTRYTQCYEATVSDDNLPATVAEKSSEEVATAEAKGSQPQPAYKPLYKPLGKYAAEFGINL